MRRWMKMSQASSESSDSELDHTRNSGPQRSGSQRGGSLRQLGGLGMLQRQAEQFGLSDEQLDRIDGLKIEFEIEKVDRKAALRKAKIRLRGLIRDVDSDAKDVYAAIRKVSRCEEALRRMRYDHLTAARQLLDDKQCSKVASFGRKQMQKKVKAFREQRRSA